MSCSAQLLMLYGIGPSEHLKSVGIMPLVDFSVWRNLEDHVMTFAGPFILKKNGSVPVSSMSSDVTLGALNDFTINGVGPFTSAMGVVATGVISSSSSPGWPNLLYFILSTGVPDGLGAAIDGIFGSGNYTAELLHPFIGQDAHSSWFQLESQKGFIELLDKNLFPSQSSTPNTILIAEIKTFKI
ncbi:Oxygen-dependent choline dehydrogenase [Orchesella cincta]|uniref:Oxygen-dependent choline dehydrogenase n=1 Tax=Orchesella cincta TaxID=48709 RepID=A0A1D2M7K5_ORCCI|nr:Oxygen-dependent choline dehydrogenase [Orchesella cincta]